MENLQTQSQDQNQLALFTLLTAEQEAYKAKLIKGYNESAQKRYNREKQIADLLESNGFGDNYKFNAQIIRTEKSISLGTYNNPLNVKVEVDECVGGTYIIYNRYNQYENKIITTQDSVREEKGKINYSYRLLKPSTLLEKVREANLRATREFEAANLKKSIIDYTVDKYSKLYPNAKVFKATDSERDYKNRYTSFEVVRIEFKSGSYITMRIGHTFDKEYIYRKFNALEKSMSITDLMDYYNQQ